MYGFFLLPGKFLERFMQKEVVAICDRICEKGYISSKNDLEKNALLRNMLSQNKIDIFIFSYRRHLLSFIYVCMKFEVTTMLPVHTTAVKRRLPNRLNAVREYLRKIDHHGHSNFFNQLFTVALYLLVCMCPEYFRS